MKSEDEKFILPYTKKLKPTLTEENKLIHLAYAAFKIESPDSDNLYVFYDDENVVHIDEKSVSSIHLSANDVSTSVRVIHSW